MAQRKRKNSDARANGEAVHHQNKKKKSNNQITEAMSQRKRKSSDPRRNAEAKRKKSNNNQITKAVPQRKRKSSDPRGNDEAKKNKLNNQNTTIAEAMPKRFNLSRCKGKSVVELPINTAEHMDVVDQAMGIHFQEEIIMEFLIRLPVRSLHRFKCVSKSWKALISDPYFKTKHLNHAQNDPNLQKFLVVKTCLDESETCDFYSSSLASDRLVDNEQKLDSSWKPWDCWILCSCDGLVLLRVYEEYNGRSNSRYVLWNPSTRESIEIPDPCFPLEECVFGLGYDITTDDYKILVIDLNLPVRYNVHCKILALKGGYWRSSRCPTSIRRVSVFIGSSMDSLALVRGAFHWLGLKQYHYAYIVSFDISNEVYGEIPLLEGMCYIFETTKPNEFIDQGVSVLGGMLCFYSAYNYQVEATFKLWVMKDYGVKESWTVLFTIQDTNLYSARPKYRYADGEVLLRCRNLENNSLFITSRGPFGLWPLEHFIIRGIIYTESLISPKLITTNIPSKIPRVAGERIGYTPKLPA